MGNQITNDGSVTTKIKNMFQTSYFIIESKMKNKNFLKIGLVFWISKDFEKGVIRGNKNYEK